MMMKLIRRKINTTYHFPACLTLVADYDLKLATLSTSHLLHGSTHSRLYLLAPILSDMHTSCASLLDSTINCVPVLKVMQVNCE